MRVGVIGGGTVGRATALAFGAKRVHDVLPERSTCAREEALDCDLVFVCLPTPLRGTELYMGFIQTFLASCAGTSTKFVLRSTVPVGTTRKLQKQFKLDIVHSPEFLTARTAALDACMPTRLLIGHCSPPSVQHMCARMLTQLYSERFPYVHVRHTSSDESELAKLADNAFSAAKVAFFNELYQLCAKLSCDFEAVRNAMLAGGRIAPLHTQVPGPDGRRGFGGECLPKDLQQFIAEQLDVGLHPWIARAAFERNQLDRDS